MAKATKEKTAKGQLTFMGEAFDYYTEKIVRNVWVAKCETVIQGVKFETTMKGVSEADAENKLKEFFKQA